MSPAIDPAEFAVIGGSGFYAFLGDVEEVELETPFGKTSAPLVIGELGGKRVAFLPRHGREHVLPLRSPPPLPLPPRLPPPLLQPGATIPVRPRQTASRTSGR